MTRTALLIMLVAAAALAGCNRQSHTITAGPDSGDNAAETNAGVQLPPPIAASKIYRCGDNQVIYVDWIADNKTANIRTESNGTPTQVFMAEPGKPMTGGGFTLTGSAAGPSVTLERPGQGKQICKA